MAVGIARLASLFHRSRLTELNFITCVSIRYLRASHLLNESVMRMTRESRSSSWISESQKLAVEPGSRTNRKEEEARNEMQRDFVGCSLRGGGSPGHPAGDGIGGGHEGPARSDAASLRGSAVRSDGDPPQRRTGSEDRTQDSQETATVGGARHHR